MNISSLSQDIDRLLHGEESIRFDDYGEGELAVLENEISKMTLRLLAQSGQLQKDKKIFSGFFGGYFPPIKDTADFS